MCLARQPQLRGGVSSLFPCVRMNTEKCERRYRYRFRGFRVEIFERTFLGRRLIMADAPAVWISGHLAEKIRAHGAETYPHESCGALLGRDSNAIVENDREKNALTPARKIVQPFPLIIRPDDSPPTL